MPIGDLEHQSRIFFLLLVKARESEPSPSQVRLSTERSDLAQSLHYGILRLVPGNMDEALGQKPANVMYVLVSPALAPDCVPQTRK